MTGLRVVLGEDSFLAREGIIRVLDEVEEIELVAACGDLPSLREAVDRLLPDVVVTDIRMPPTATDEGIRLARELRTAHPGIGVVVLSQHADPLYSLALFEQGSNGRAYLLKERLADGGELVHAIEEVAVGGSLVDTRVVDALIVELRRRDGSPLDRLSERELEILGLVAEGRSNGAIAGELVVTKRAVERQINAIFAKLELNESESVSRRVKAALVYLSDGAP